MTLYIIYGIITVTGLSLSRRFLYYYSKIHYNSRYQGFIDKVIKKYRIYFWTSFIPFINLFTVGWIVWVFSSDNWKAFHLDRGQRKWLTDSDVMFYKGLGLGIATGIHPLSNAYFFIMLVPFFSIEIQIRHRKE